MIAVTRFAASTSTGTQDITASLSGQTPSGVMFFASSATANNTITAHGQFAVGATSGSGEQWSVVHRQEDGASGGGQNSKRIASKTKCLIFMDDASVTEANVATDGEAAFSSFITNGVRINWTSAPSAAYLVTALFFYGTGVLCHANALEYTNGDSKTIDVTAPGFEPDLVFLHNADDFDDAGNSYSYPGLGIVHNGSGGVQHRTQSLRSGESFGSVSRLSSMNSDSISFAKVAWNSTGNEMSWTLSGFDSSGFTASLTDTQSRDRALGYFAVYVDDALIWLDDIQTGTSAGDVSYTGTGFTPQAIVMVGGALTAMDSTADSGDGAEAFSVGAATSSSSYSIANSFADNVSTTASDSVASTDILRAYDGDNNLLAGATLKSVDSDGFTLNFASAPTASYNWIALAIEENASGTNYTLSATLAATSATPDTVNLTRAFELSGIAAATSATPDATLTRAFELAASLDATSTTPLTAGTTVPFSTDFETGDLSDFAGGIGEAFGQSTYWDVSVVAGGRDGSSYAVELSLDFGAATGVTDAAYLFVYSENLSLPDGAYIYEAWYYIPSSASVSSWWNIGQFKKSTGGAYWTLDLGGSNYLKLYSPQVQSFPPLGTSAVEFPRDEWVKISVYYDWDIEAGTVIVFQNDQEIINVSGYPTVFDAVNEDVYWSVNNYTDSDNVSGSSVAIKVDDMRIVSVDRATLTREYGLSSALAATSTTPDVTLERAFGLAATTAATSATPDDVTLARALNLTSVLAGTSITPDDATLTISQAIQLAATLAATSTTPDDATLARAFVLSSTAAATSATPDATLTRAIQLASTLAGTSTTPDTATLTRAWALAAELAVTSATDDTATLSRAFQLAATLAGTSTTPDDAVLNLTTVISLAAVMAVTSTTPDDATLIRALSLAAAAAATSTTPDDAVLSRVLTLAATLAGSSATPDTAALTRVFELVAMAAATSTTPDDAAIASAYRLAATLAATSTTPDDVTLERALQLAATLGITSETPDDVVLLITGTAVGIVTVAFAITQAGASFSATQATVSAAATQAAATFSTG